MNRRQVFCFGFLVVFALLASTALAFALDPPVTQTSFVGTWQAQFQNKPFITLTLTNQSGLLGGAVSETNIQLDQNGELISAEQKDAQDSVSEVSLNGNTLRITAKEQNSSSTIQYEMTLIGSDQAELQLVGTAAGAIAPKPWKLSRMADSAAAQETSPPQDIKSKLAAAAHTWLAGQFGTTAAPVSDSSSSTSTALPAGSIATSGKADSTAPKISDLSLDTDLQKSLDGLPRRVRDQFKNQGDMVNFVLIGSEQQVQSALDAAHWHLADRNDKLAVLNAITQTYQKKDYLAMPMSTLYLFDRPQDFGYEEADPYAVVASRHHFRLWKAPFLWNGQLVWVGAGTHDIGFEKDQRNGKVTHKIDPSVDGERDNIGTTLQKAGKTKSLNYYLPSDPVQEAKNATGGGYHSDGRLLVIVLQ